MKGINYIYRNIIHKGQKYKYKIILLFLVLSYTFIMTTLTYYKYYCFKSYAFDMGIFIQIFWNTINGNPMYTQPRGSVFHPTNFFGVHFSPFLYLIMPVFEIFPNPYTLFLIQSLFLSITAIVIYYISLHILKDERISVLFSALYLIYPGTLWSNWYDFHVEAFIPLFSSLVYYYYLRENNIGVFISLFTLVSILERNVFIAVAFAVYFAAREIYNRRIGQEPNKSITPLLIGAILVFSILYFIYSEQYINNFSVNRSTSKLESIIGYVSYSNLLEKTAFVTFLMAPLAFLQIDAPLELIPAGPYMVLVALTSYSPYFEITWQYPAIVSVPFFVSAIMGAQKKSYKGLFIKLTFFSLIFFFLLSPGSPLMARLSNSWKIVIPDENNHLKNSALESIETKASVLAQENIFPNIAMRNTVYSYWPPNHEPPDYIVLDIEDYWLYTEPSEQTLEDYILNGGADGYGIWAYVDGFIIIKKDYRGDPVLTKELCFELDYQNSRTRFISYEKSIPETNYFIPDWVDIQKDGLYIEPWYNISIWWGPYILLPPGDYRITVEIITNDVTTNPILEIQAYSMPRGIYGQWEINGSDNMRFTEILRFSLDEWVPEFEIVGRNYGNANYTVTRVTLEGEYG